MIARRTRIKELLFTIGLIESFMESKTYNIRFTGMPDKDFFMDENTLPELRDLMGKKLLELQEEYYYLLSLELEEKNKK